MNNPLLTRPGAVAEFERSLSLERQCEGIGVAKVAARYRGRKAKLIDDQAAELRACLAAGAATKLAGEYGVSRASIDTYRTAPGAAR